MVSKRTILLDNKQVAIRSYEVSIWSLQDSFITVLKWADIDNKGQIQEPKMVLDVDGTQDFSFSIPMYLNPGQENPIWYNTLNGNLMIGMRKIKVILNKRLDDEAVFEFLITKVTERHEADTLFCDVECEGLAFHELGKIGYKIALSADIFYLEFEDWFNSDQTEEMPRQTIQYWNDKTGFLLPLPDDEADIIPNKWYYTIEMNWDSYNSNLTRDKNKVYENEFVASWDLRQNKLIPRTVEDTKEKERPVEISESNMYNITQKIAESFGVFCRYEYGYDDNYHIISRKVIYYNNFIEEEDGHMDLTYPYHTSEITREMDSSELTTKLFVRPVDYEYSDSGQVSIMSVDANKSREDYILNFDYLHKFNIITDEQYDEIANYEQQMHNLNLLLESMEPQIDNLKNRINDYEAKLQVAEVGIGEADKQLNISKDHISALQQDENYGVVHITQRAPKSVLVLTDSTDNSFYVKMPFAGIIPSTVQLYDGIIDYTKTENQLINDNTVLIQGGTLEFDQTVGELIKITHLPQTITVQGDEGPEPKPLNSSLWLVCDYIPYTYWTKIRDYWEQEKVDIEEEARLYREDILPQLNTQLENLETAYNDKLEEKRKLIKEFEEMMGPALREGYWQPEDYKDYGNKYIIKNIFTEFEEGEIQFLPIDENYYDGCSKVTYYSGPKKQNYLAINLGLYNSVPQTTINYIKENYKDLYFIYYDIQGVEQVLTVDVDRKASYERNALRLIHIGGEDCRFGYIKLLSNATNNNLESNQVYFALIIEASKNMTEEQAAFLANQNGQYSDSKYTPYRSKMGTVSVGEDTGAVTIDEEAKILLPENFIFRIYNDRINNQSVIEEVYPRIIIDSLALKTGNEFLSIKLNNNLLKAYEDYNIFVATDLNDDFQNQHDKYFIDLKIEAILNSGTLTPFITIGYELSNADTLIYLDALQVAKENSEPKVSYTIKLSLYDPYIVHNIYKKLSKIVHINDIQLKFENVQGYISQIEMNLDKPWEDSIEIKNYKTKFEDLFSNIVAQTDAMQKKSHDYDVAAAAFDSTGSLTSEAVIKVLTTNAPIFNTFIDERLSNNPALAGVLTSVFNDAGEILNSAGNALADMRAVTSTNASILTGFVRGADEGFGKGIDLVSSVEGNYTSAVQINNQGIFVGSDQRVSLYSGVIGDENSGVSIDLNPERLILGASSSQNTTAAKFTDKYLVLAAGDVISNSETFNDDGTLITDLETLNVDGTINGLVGAKFTHDSIGMATLDEEHHIINSILMNNRGITLGSGVYNEQENKDGIDLDQDTVDMRNLNITDASYVRISGKGMDIGSGGELYVNTQNFKVNSNALGENSIFELSKTVFDEDTQTSTYIPALKYSIEGGLEISGRIVANELKIFDPTFDGNDKYRFATDWVNAKVTPQEIWLKVKKATDPTQENDYQGTSLQLTDNMVSISSGGIFNVNTTNLIINSAATGANSIFELKKQASDWTPENNHYDTALKYSITNGLIITGSLTADTGSIGGWTIGNNSLYSGSSTNYVALDSGTLNEDYAIWAGGETSNTAPFAVLRNGQVYLNKLMVLDPTESLPGDHVTKGNEKYTAIDFSRLNFKQAVSVSGSWSGSDFNVKVSLWGVLDKTEKMGASVDIKAGTVTLVDGDSADNSTASATIEMYINNQMTNIGTQTFPIDASAAFNVGYQRAHNNTSVSYSASYLSDSRYTLSIYATDEQDDSQIKSKSSTFNAIDAYNAGVIAGLDEGYENGYNAGWNACRSKVASSGTRIYYYLKDGDDYVRDSRYVYTSLPAARS